MSELKPTEESKPAPKIGKKRKRKKKTLDNGADGPKRFLTGKYLLIHLK
jgi:hypothetical protein